MDNIKRLVQENNLIKEGETVGIGVSGGKDSMALLHYLNKLSKEMNFEVVAITIDHGIRENSPLDAMFVMDYCRKNKIRAYKFRLDVPALAKEKSLSLESAARQGRFGVFESMVQKRIVDKIALAHHQSDQAETVLMHLLRGSGITGLKGMSLMRDNVFIRPMLETNEKAIWQYVCDNDIEYREDETNQENEYNRNYIRNEILPAILKRWPNAIQAILNFSNLASQDDEYINSQVPTSAFIVNEKEVKIPLNYFIYPAPIVARMVYRALNMIGVHKDIESKHIELITNFVKNSENGKRIELPLKVSVHKEYDFITLTNKQKEEIIFEEKFRLGSFIVPNFGKVTIKKVNKINKDEALYLDADLVPKDVVVRFRKNGDVFEKFGGGTKKLKSYLIDKKIPSRVREYIPLVAKDQNVYVIIGVEISDKVKVTDKTKRIYRISVEK